MHMVPKTFPNLLFLRIPFHLLTSVFDIEIENASALLYKSRSNYILVINDQRPNHNPPLPLRSVDRLQQHETELDAAAPAERHPATQIG